MVWLYGTPGFPAGRLFVPAAQESHLMSITPWMVRVRSFVATVPAPSVTCGVMVYTPNIVGVPVMDPVLESILRPVGSGAELGLIPHVYVPVPPEACRNSE